MVDHTVDLSQADDGLFFRVQWDGLPDEADYTWRPIPEIYTDVPKMVTDFLRDCKKSQKLVATARRQLDILN